MGVVRRKGEWRLEKRNESYYEITYKGNLQLKVYTEENRVNDPLFTETVPVRVVSGYSEAEGLFEEYAHGPSPADKTDPIQADIDYLESDGTGELEDLPPFYISIILLLAGSIVAFTFWPAVESLPFLVGVLLAVAGSAVIGYGAFLIRTEDWATGWEFLMEVDQDSNNDSTETEKTPPAPEKLRHKLYYDRANRQCEHCGDEIDHPEVHHIIPRSEGGPNELNNLLVLCPSCHRKADAGMLSKSQLKYRVKERMEQWDESGLQEAN